MNAYTSKNEKTTELSSTAMSGTQSQALSQSKLMQRKQLEQEEMFQGDPIQKKNKTGLPDQLKSGMENLSGLALDDVKVHYNSSKPESLNAHAYAQGSDIHLASGQEKHLPHELGHIVQQSQGRVKPTTEVGGAPVNDNASLESEADSLGRQALQRQAFSSNMSKSMSFSSSPPQLKKKPKTKGTVTPVDEDTDLSYKDLLARAKGARSTADNEVKLQFLKDFSEHYAPHLTGEIEYFQFLSQKVAYMDLREGDEIGANIDTSQKEKEYKAVGGIGIDKSTKKINKALAKYNALKTSKTFDYKLQYSALLKVSTGISEWNKKYGGGKNQRAVQMLEVEKLSERIEMEFNSISAQKANQQGLISDQTDTASDYSENYKVEKTYHNKAGLNATLILPKDKDPMKNAIVLFRGTGGNTIGKARGEVDGVLADTDYGGVGRVAFDLGNKEMDSWLKTVKGYNRITIAGHSLGGAMAERFYIKASKSMASKLRLITYQGAAIDRYTTGKAMGKNDPQRQGAKSTRVVARGDIVPLGGMAHVGGQKLKYSASDGKKHNPKDAHLQTDLARQQIDAALGKTVEQVTNIAVHDKEGGTNKTKMALTAGKHLVTAIGHTLYSATVLGLVKMVKAGTSSKNIK